MEGTEMALTTLTWLVMLASIAMLWGTSGVALYKSLHDEDQKLELLQQQETIDTYSPHSLAELQTWIESNPDDPLAEEGRHRYNDCVETLQDIDETFYDWSDEEIESLEKL